MLVSHLRSFALALALLFFSLIPAPIQGAEPVVCSFSLRTHSLEVHWNSDRSTTLSDIEAPYQLVTNGPLFEPNFNPVGLLITEGIEHFPLNTTDGRGNFYLKPNGVFFIEGGQPHIDETLAFNNISVEPDLAFQSGPLLLHNGVLHQALLPDSNSRFTRNVIGIDDKNTIYIVIFTQPTTLFDTAAYLKDQLKCHAALYLDGSISGYKTEKGQKNIFKDYGSVLVVRQLTGAPASTQP